MIAKLKGLVEEVEKDRVVIDVNGVGYSVHISELDRNRLPAIGTEIIAQVYTHVREDALDLYGFLEKIDRDLFVFLMEANGVGPKLALTVLSHMEGHMLLQAIRSGDLQLLSTIPGIGKKKAERLVMELRDKCEKRFADWIAKGSLKATAQSGKAGSTPGLGKEWTEDLQAALLGLGYRDMDIRRAIAYTANQDGISDNLEAYLKACLKFLNSNNARTIQGNA